MLTLIAAHDLNGAIGRDGDIPWHVPEDFAFFKRETTGGAVIMGRKTWDSLPKRPLPGRMNIVVTRSGYRAGPEAVFCDLDQAVPLAIEAGHDRLFCIGGAEIYRKMLDKADRLLLSTVHVTVPDADTYFPQIDPQAWRQVGGCVLRAADPHCTLTEYRRIR